MPVYFQKPENALKRANEFVDVGKKEAALDILYDVIKSKKHRTWQKIHEPILQKYLSLCVDLKRSVNAKEGLYQYKLICQQVNIFSLEEVISFFLKLADEMADGARNQSIELVAVEDLDMVQTPEGIMLSSVSSEDAQDRSDRLLLTPWVKFLWEAYRNVLELLRNNNRLERLYHDTAQNAFKFCLKYKRRAEFRKLCNLIKNHLDQVLKYQTQPTSVNLNAPESLQLNLETRLFQLESAITMELWQEAFRAIEGIHYLMQLSKKPPKPHMMANYYEKVALVFLKAGNFLFHGAALLKLFVLTKEHKKSATQDELQSLSNRVVLAMLSIAVTPGQSAMEAHLNYNASKYEKEMKLTQLLGLLQVPTRKSCGKELSIVLPYASEDVVALYAALEEQFQPTRLCKKVDEILTRLSESEKMKQYVPSVQKTAIVRMLKQVSQLYETMHFEKLLSLIPFADQFALQRAIVEGVKNGTVQASLDHRTKAVTFGSALVVAMKEEVPEGPHIQAMPSEILRNQLISLSEGLSAVMPLMMGGALEREGASQREQVVQQYLRAERKEHQQILNRKSTIEARKEKIESLKHEQERFERDKINKQSEKLKAAEETRLEEEREKREKDRRLAEMKEIQKQQVWDRVALLRETDTGKKAFKHLTQEEIDEMDPEDILVKQAEQMDKEKRDLTVKLKTQEKKVDFFVRACRLFEIPKVQAHQDGLQVHNQTVWEEEERNRIEATEKEHHVAVEMKERLSVMQDAKQAFLDKLFGNRHAEYQVRLTEFDSMVEEAREERLAVRRKQRMAGRREEFILKQREEKQKLNEEIRKKEEEIERRRLEVEAEERKRKEEEDEAKREEIERKKQEREREIEEKMKQREAERLQERLQERENMMRGGGGGQDDGKRGGDREPAQDWRSGGGGGGSGGGDSGGGGGGDSSAPPAGGGSRYVPPSMRNRQVQSDSPKEPERKAEPEPEAGGWRRGGGDDRRQDDGGGDRRMDDRGGSGGGGGDGNRWNRGGDGPPSGGRAAFGDRSGGGDRFADRGGGGGAFGDRGGGDRGGDSGGGDSGGGDSGSGPWNRNREGAGERPVWGNRGGDRGGDGGDGGDSAGGSGPWGGNRNRDGGSAWGNRDGGGGGGGGAWGNRDGGRDGGRGEGRSYQASRVSRD